MPCRARNIPSLVCARCAKTRSSAKMPPPRTLDAFAEAIEMAEAGLCSLEGGDPESTTWGVCRFCSRPDWAGHKANCEGAQKIAEWKTILEAERAASKNA